MLWSYRLRLSVVFAAVVALLALAPVLAFASTASEEQQGAALVKALNAGDRTCASLSAGDFERIGEYAMGLNFATVAQHETMNAHMRAMMGLRGEELAHQAMGRAYSACLTAAQRRSGAYAYGPGMMGGYGAASGAGSARLAGAGGGHHDWSAGAVIGVAVLAAALAGGLVAVLVTRRHRLATGAS